MIVQDSATILGNIKIGDGAVITAKSIVLKEVPPFARVSGIPAKVRSYRFEDKVSPNITKGQLLESENGTNWDREVEEATQIWEGTSGDDDWFELQGLLEITPDEEEELKIGLRDCFTRWADKEVWT